MKSKAVMSVLVAGLFTSSAFADHNSKWGEGWANMPNDIHNTRLDTRDGDNTVFTDFVKYGNGADSVNRFAETDSFTRAMGVNTRSTSLRGGSISRGSVSASRGGRR